MKWGRAALMWTYCPQPPRVTREILAGFPVTAPREKLNIPTSLSPRSLQRVSGSVPQGLQFPEGVLGSANLGVREAKQLASRPPDLASTRTVLYCSNPGREETYTIHSVGK